MRPLADTDPDISLFRALRDDGTLNPAAQVDIPTDVLLRAYREMRRLRVLDAKMILLQRQGRVGFYGAAQGQEATPIAAGLALQADDWVFQALREQSVMLVRGFPVEKFVAQIFGNSGDVLKGRMQPSHPSSKSVHQVSWSSCIATQLPHAVGAAWAMKLRKATTIAMAFSGDGGTSEPDFHAALGFAATYKVPVVVVCQNNHWSISVPTSKQTASRTIAVKARAYGIPGVRVDGNDFLAVYKVLSDAIARARSGGGPTFVEALTYRIGAHSTSDDPTRYRSDAEVESWKKKDPLDRLRRHLAGLGLVGDESDRALDEQLGEQINEAVKMVEALPPPARESLFDDVYAELPWNLREQKEDLFRHPPAPTH